MIKQLRNKKMHLVKVLLANYTSIEATWGNKGSDDSQVPTFICDNIAYLYKNHKFQGQNSLRRKTVRWEILKF